MPTTGRSSAAWSARGSSAPADVRWLPLAELEAAGYGFVLPEGGCGRPDCGNGRCGRSAPDAS